METACEPLTADPQLAASRLRGAMVGVSRSMLATGVPEEQLETMRRELILVTCSYLDAEFFPFLGSSLKLRDRRHSNELRSGHAEVQLGFFARTAHFSLTGQHAVPPWGKAKTAGHVDSTRPAPFHN